VRGKPGKKPSHLGRVVRRKRHSHVGKRPAREEEEGLTGAAKSQVKFDQLSIKTLTQKNIRLQITTSYLFLLFNSLLEFRPMLKDFCRWL
jgi:hypothetical protein